MINFFISVTSHALDPPLPVTNSHLLGPPPPSSVTYFMDSPPVERLRLYQCATTSHKQFYELNSNRTDQSGRNCHRFMISVAGIIVHRSNYWVTPHKVNRTKAIK